MIYNRNCRGKAGSHSLELRERGVTLIGDLSPKDMLNLVLNALPVSLFWKDWESRILGCNQKFADDSGARIPADLIGKTNFDFYPPEQAEAFRADDLEVMTTGRTKLGIEESVLLATGETAWVETNKVPMRNTAGLIIGVLCTYRDITERRRAGDERMRFSLELAAAKQAASMAMHDALTGLPNRRYLEEKLHSTFLNTEQKDRHAIIAVDLDRFKAINDLYGHAIGDELLKKLGSLLTEEVGDEGFAARVGGDEFILLMKYKSNADLGNRLSKIIARFDMSIALSEYEVSVGITLGVAVAPANGIDPELLVRRADLALYRAKRQGRGRFVFFEPSMETDVQSRALLERDLRAAIKNDQLIPYFQPQKYLATGEVSCYEVTPRWPRAEGDLMGWNQFTQIAEDIGVVGALKMNLLRRACLEVLNWPGKPRISIGISPIELRDTMLPQRLLEVLTDCEFPPSRLEIEITEDALLSDFDASHAILNSLKTLGLHIALDNFGVGYSSFQRLRLLPLDTLKIDEFFAQSIHEGEDALLIVRAVVQLAKSLGFRVTAKGIETETQAFALQSLGCERGQGSYIGESFPGLMHERNQKLKSVQL